MWLPRDQQRYPLFILSRVFWILLYGHLDRHCDICETLHRLLTLSGTSMNLLWFPLRGNFILHRVKRFTECQRQEPQVIDLAR